MAFTITEEVAALIPMKGTSTGADLHEEVKNVLESLNNLMDKRY